ncbi:hypothetical protein E3Q03_03945 [Wallemia mellicola]|uniref:Telomeric single stranded DNA binding POT1/Cdc13 domain-containing protein n=1 Tax=Wallemia mellicola TaxID=1708541 RepID=A0AB74KA52_9BASI|nr:hypothetical protein E3Q03_03945 [Wallemia mellicola]
MELYTGAPTKSQLSNKRPIYDDYVKIIFMRIPLDHTEEELFDFHDKTELSSSLKKANNTSDFSIRNPPMYNFSVNNLISIQSVYFNVPHIPNKPINVILYILSAEIKSLKLKNGLQMKRLFLTGTDEAGLPIQISIFENEVKKINSVNDEESVCRTGDIIYLESTNVKVREMEGIPTPFLTNGTYTVCYRYNIYSQDKNWRRYRPDWLATHRPSLRVLKLYEWIESNL